MQGRILAWEPLKKAGIVIGDDGFQYLLFADDLLLPEKVRIGESVSFVVEGRTAKLVMLLPEVSGVSSAVVGDFNASKSRRHEKRSEKKVVAAHGQGGASYYSDGQRASRSQYWFIKIGMVFVIYFYVWYLGFRQSDTAYNISDSIGAIWTVIDWSLIVGGGLMVLLSVIGFIVVIVGRCHDIGWPGWAALGLLLPIINVVVGLQIMFRGSRPPRDSVRP